MSDKRKFTSKLTAQFFFGFAFLGAVLFFIFKYTLLGGLGLGLSLFGLASWFHFRKYQLLNYNPNVEQTVDSKMTWFLLVLILVGVLLLFSNIRQEGPEFYNGISVGLICVCAVAYVGELLLNWLSGFR